jgi:uncharacterized protein (DUF433 family)
MNDAHQRAFLQGPKAMLTDEEIAKRVKRNPEIYGGRPIIRGTRIPVWVIADGQFQGLSIDEIIDDFPDLTVEDVEAALAFIASGKYEPWELDPQLPSAGRRNAAERLSRGDSPPRPPDAGGLSF